MTSQETLVLQYNERTIRHLKVCSDEASVQSASESDPDPCTVWQAKEMKPGGERNYF